MLKLLQRRAAPSPVVGEGTPAPPADGGPSSSLGPEDALRGLVRASLGGSRAAERTLLTSLGPAMLQMIRRVLGARDPEVEDAFQEAAWGLIRALPTFRETCSTRHFACRIALLTAFKARRRRGSNEVLSGDLPDEGEVLLAQGAEGSSSPSPSEEVVAQRQRVVLRRMLDELPEAQATVMVLHCVGGFTVEEVAASMATPLETARSRLRLAKTTLRQLIAANPAAAELLEVTP